MHDGVFEVNAPEKTKGNLVGGMYNSTGGTSAAATSQAAETSEVEKIPSIEAHVHTNEEHADGSHEHDMSEETTSAAVAATTDAEESTETVAATSMGGGSDVSAAIRAIEATEGGEVELVLYENTNMGDGRYANNPFLQENPDNITKVTWDNVVAVSKKFAEAKGWD